MLAVVKKPRTRRPQLEIRGKIPKWMLSRLKKEYGRNLEIKSDDEDFLDVFETTWFRRIDSKSTPGGNMRLYRENMGLTQVELGDKLGNIPRKNISAMEKNRRGISKEIAKKLAQVLKAPVERFL